MTLPRRWMKEPGARVEGARDLDRSKVQAPCTVRAPGGGFRLFYTAVGPGRPFATCQGYILSATSRDGLDFAVEPGMRVAPDPAVAQMSLRVLAPSVTAIEGGGFRMYFEARGPADIPNAVMSAVSEDQLNWRIESGVRLTAPGGVGAPRFSRLADGRGRLFCFESVYPGVDPASGPRIGTHVISAVTRDGLSFEREPGVRLADKHDAIDSAGITAAEVVGDSMVFSAWQDVPAGTIVPVHPSADLTTATADFAAASIAADMSGYRSRILMASSDDGMAWTREDIIIEGDGYRGDDIDAVHAEDMSLIELDDGRWRMYYAACDAHGVWRVASAISA